MLTVRIIITPESLNQLDRDGGTTIGPIIFTCPDCCKDQKVSIRLDNLDHPKYTIKSKGGE